MYESFANSLGRICSAYSQDPQIGIRRLKQKNNSFVSTKSLLLYDNRIFKNTLRNFFKTGIEFK